MKRILYHGSKNIIKQPVFGAGKIHNDYGNGFYCTEIKDLAMEWAVASDRDGYCNEYSFDDSGLKSLDLRSDEFSVLHWITILLQNRTFELSSPLAKEAFKYLTENFSLNSDAYDVITGYRADDSYFDFANDFINGVISVRQLSLALKLGRLGSQYVLKSKAAFDRIEYSGNEMAESRIWYPRRDLRDRKARKDYRDTDKIAFTKGDIYIVKIIEEEINADDPRIR